MDSTTAPTQSQESTPRTHAEYAISSLSSPMATGMWKTSSRASSLCEEQVSKEVQPTNTETTMGSSMSNRTSLDSDSHDGKHGFVGLPYVYHRKRTSVCSSEYFTEISISEPLKIPIDPTHQDRNRQSPNSKFKFQFWKSKSNNNAGNCHLSQIDLVGYRFLAKPVQIEYSNILCSWRFSEELSARKMLLTGCRDHDCCGGRYEGCKNDVKLEFMVLDDSKTWVLVDRTVTRSRKTLKRELTDDKSGTQKEDIDIDMLKTKKRGSKKGIDNEVLFCAEIEDSETMALKPLSENDGICARIRLGVFEGRVVCPAGVGEEERDWMKIVRYCG